MRVNSVRFCTIAQHQSGFRHAVHSDRMSVLTSEQEKVHTKGGDPVHTASAGNFFCAAHAPAYETHTFVCGHCTGQ